MEWLVVAKLVVVEGGPVEVTGDGVAIFGFFDVDEKKPSRVLLAIIDWNPRR